MFRLIDKALIDWLKSLSYKDKSGNIKTIENVVYASPEKAFSKGKLNQNGRIILPAISLFRISVLEDDEEWKYPVANPTAYNYNLKDFQGLNQKTAGFIPVDISYQVDIWTKYQDDLQYIWFQIIKQFNPELILRVTALIDELSLDLELRCILEAINDNSDLEPDEEDDRKLRATADIKVNTFIPTEVKQWKLIKVIQVKTL